MSSEPGEKNQRKRTKNLKENQNNDQKQEISFKRKKRNKKQKGSRQQLTTNLPACQSPRKERKSPELDFCVEDRQTPKFRINSKSRKEKNLDNKETKKSKFSKSVASKASNRKQGDGKGVEGQRKWRRLNEMASCSSGEVTQTGKNASYFSKHPVFRKESKKLGNGKNLKCSTHLPMEEDAAMPELPGFYYDREKKKYFKILPNDSCIGNAVTHASIQVKEKERTRKTDLFHSSQLRNNKQNLKSHQTMSMNNMPCLACHMQQGILSPQEMSWSLHKLRLRNIKKTPQTHIKLYPNQSSYWFEQLEHVSQLEMIENKRIVGLFSLKDSMVQRIIWLKLKEKPRENESDRLSLSVDPSPDYGYYQSSIKISSMRLIDTDSILYTGMVYTGTPESLVFIKGLGEGSSRYEVYSIGQKATWTCAWNKHANQFSVGSEKCGLLLDVQTRRLWEINTYNGDVLCQVFSRQNGNYLYSGTRKNQIFTHDLRSISTYSVNQLTMSSSVCGLQILQNDIHLLASDVKGKIASWDLRMRKIVTEYQGQKNEYLKIPIHVDEHEEFVYGVDQDGYTRLWCLLTGELLKTIPPPKPTSYDFFPSILYSRNWLDESGNAGLLMGLGDKIYVYSDYQDFS